MRTRASSIHTLNRPHGHRLAWRERAANANAPVWLVLHGGPGSGGNPGLWQPLLGSQARLYMPDQRGTGASQPRGGTRRNNVSTLVADIEALRQHAGVERWSILAGSWGSTLALKYAAEHPEVVERLVLRGSFAVTRKEVLGLLRRVVSPAQRAHVGQIARFLPDAQLPAEMARLSRVLQSGALGVTALDVLRRWGLAEMAMARRGIRRSLRHAVLTGDSKLATSIRSKEKGLARQARQQVVQLGSPRMGPQDRHLWRKFRIQCHYLVHWCFVRPGDLDRSVRLMAQRAIPVAWVHGRFDEICPPENTRKWMAAGKDAALRDGVERPRLITADFPLSGHLGFEPAMLAALQRAVSGGVA